MDGWAVEWGYVTGSYVEAPGGEPKQIHGTRPPTPDKLPDGSWKCFRGMGGPTFTAPVVRASRSKTGRVGWNRERGGDADLAGIKKLHQQDIAATLSRDPVALTDPWTDDAVRLAQLPRRHKSASRRSRESQLNARRLAPGVKVLAYVPEIKDLTILDGLGSRVAQHHWFSLAESPGGEPKQVRGTVLGLYKKLADWQLESLPAGWGPQNEVGSAES